MSAHERIWTPTSRVPVVESDIFQDNSERRFGIGIIADGVDIDPSSEHLFQGYLQLRANVYIKEREILSRDALRPDGTEVDGDDKRSVHIVALENLSNKEDLGVGLGRVAIFGCMRLIQKNEIHNELLPIESFYEEEFGERPAKDRSLEVSRLIVRHSDRYSSAMAQTGIFSKGVAYALKNHLGPAYGVVETKLHGRLEQMNVPTEVIAAPRYIPKYNTDNIGIMIDVDEFGRRLGEDVVNNLQAEKGKFEFWGDQSVDNSLDSPRV